MSAGYFNMLCEQGATLLLNINWADPDGNPIDLTGYTALMQVRPSKESPTIIVELSTANGYIVLGGVSGAIGINLPDTVTAGLAAGNYLYDMLLTNGGEAIRLIEGPFVVSGEVTQ